MEERKNIPAMTDIPDGLEYPVEFELRVIHVLAEGPALAAGLAQMLERLEREGEALGRLCRARVEAEFSLPGMVAGTQALLEELLRK